MEKEKTTNKSTKRQVLSATRWIQAGLAFGLAFILASWAIDSGSLLQYAAALVLFGLGVSHVLQAMRLLRSKK
jgi:hypothetical protein